MDWQDAITLDNFARAALSSTPERMHMNNTHEEVAERAYNIAYAMLNLQKRIRASEGLEE